METTEVVVVGSGPTGPPLAAEPALAGVDVDAHQRAIATVTEGHFAWLPVPLSYDGWWAWFGAAV